MMTARYVAPLDALSHSELLITVLFRFLLQRRTSLYYYKIGLPYAVACLTGIASFLVAAGSARRYFFACVSLTILAILLVTLGNQLGTHATHTPYAIKCIAINMITLAISLAISTLLRVGIERLQSICPPLPRAVATMLDTNGMLAKVMCLSDERRPKSIKSDQQLTNGGDVLRADADDENDAIDANPFIMDGASTAMKEWALMAQFLDRICFLCYVIATIVYHS